MNVIRLNLLYLVCLCGSVSINRKNDTLEVYRKDISSVGNAVASLTVDVIRGILKATDIEEEEEETTTLPNVRKVRSAKDDLDLCQQRCNENFAKNQQIESQQIRDLKLEVGRLQELVKLLKEQHKVIDLLDQQNATSIDKQTREDSGDDNLPNTEQLRLIKRDLKEVVTSLNQTRQLINSQKRKDELIELELQRQQDQITKLKAIVDKIVTNSTEKGPVVGSRMSVRTSNLSDLRKLLKSLPSDDEDEDLDSDDLRSQMAQLQKQLRKKKKSQNLSRELKALEKSIGDEDSDEQFLRELIKTVRKPDLQSKTDDIDVNSLDDLEEAINRLRPKEDTNTKTLQFQAMLNKLFNKPSASSISLNLNKPQQQRPQPQQQQQQQEQILAPQIFDLPKKYTQSNVQYICIPDDGSYRFGSPRNFQYYAPPPAPPDYGNAVVPQQFFPGAAAQPAYYSPPSANGPSQDKSASYPTETANANYQTDLKQQISGIQAAIDNLNRPEYTQNAEDKSIVNDLERQIGDLRSLVDNLNYDSTSSSYRSNRPKRTVENNQIDGSDELIQGVSDILETFLTPQQEKKQHIVTIQDQINALKKQLDPHNKMRASYPSYQPDDSNYFTKPHVQTKHIKSTKHTLLSKLVSIILDKIYSVVPVVVKKLFKFGFDSFLDKRNFELQPIVKHLGIFGFLPVLVLRLHNGVMAIIKVFKKDIFIKHFLVPTVLLGIVALAVMFLIWWLGPDDTLCNNYEKYDSNGDNYGPHSHNQYTNNYHHHSNHHNRYPVSNYPSDKRMYSRSYLNK